MAQKGSTRQWRHDARAFPFLLPFMVVFGVFVAFPLFYSFWISLHEVSLYSDFYNIFGTMNYIGFEHYVRLSTDVVFWWSIFLTLVYAALTIAPGIALSLILALALNRRMRGLGILRSGFYLPNVFDIYVVGVIWLLIFNPSGGPVSLFLDWLGAKQLASDGLLGNPWTTLPAIGLAMVLKNAGFGMILFLVSLNSINQSIFEAAEVDGATPFQKVWHITIPLLRPIIFFLTITGLMASLNAFAEIYAMTNNTGGESILIGEQTLQAARISGFHLFTVFDQARYGEAAAISFFLLAIALILSIINFAVIRPERRS